MDLYHRKRFAKQIIKQGKLDYNGNGNEIREYIHVHDAARLSVDVLNDIHTDCAITITGNQAFRVSDVFSLLFEILSAIIFQSSSVGLGSSSVSLIYFWISTSSLL